MSPRKPRAVRVADRSPSAQEALLTQCLAAGRTDAYDATAPAILRGLYAFHHDSDSDWTAWAPDDARPTRIHLQE